MLYWLCLAGAIVLEIAGTTSMKLSQGFTRTLPSVLLFVFYASSFALMTVAVKRIDNVGPEPFGATYQRVDARPYRGQRLRWSAWLRTEDARGSVTGGGAVLLIQAMQSGAPLAFNHMTDAPVRGTTPWQQFSIELDVPAAAEEIEVGAMLHGPGRLWLDDVVLEALPRT